MILDSETKAVELPGDHGNELRLWLRLLTCTTLIEGEVRSRLRERFDVTLPRFDLMAQLDKVPEGMTLSDVSKRMMVSNGNVTGLVERLVESGHLDRRTSANDRRVQVIRLTKAGRAEFRKMAAEHENWIADIFADLSPKDVRELMRLLAKTKASAQKSAQSGVVDRVTGVDYEVEYNNRARVPENPALMAGWARDAAAYREQHAPRVIAYGPARAHASMSLPAKAEGPIVVFIHGGYWQALDGSWFSHMARGLNAHGIGVAVPSYDLCPQVSVAEIIGQMRRRRASWRGSAGRLSSAAIPPAGISPPACWRPTGRRSTRRCRADLVIAAYAISGLFDLEPLVATSINKALGLDQAAARAASPLFWTAPARGSLDAVVGGKESAEYHRQSRTHGRTLGRGRPCHAIRRGSRRQSFHRDCAAGRSGFADDLAAEAIGRALDCKRRCAKSALGRPRFRHLRQITLSIK